MKIFPSGLKRISQSQAWYFDECGDTEAVVITVLKYLEHRGRRPQYLDYSNNVAKIKVEDTEFTFSAIGSWPDGVLRVESTNPDYLVRDFNSHHHTLGHVKAYIEQVSQE